MATRLAIEEDGLVPAVEAVAHDRVLAVNPPPLRQRDVAAYGIAAFGPGLLATSMNAYVPQLYAKEFGISLAALGTALVSLRIFSAISDQVIGFVSDRTRTRWGARKPWIVAGSGLMLLAAFFLLRPPPMVGLVYLVIWKLVYDLAANIIDINYTSWGAELSGDYDTRSKITGARAFFMLMGNLGNDALPIVVAFLGLTATSAFSIETLGYFFIVALVLIPLLTGFSLKRAPRGLPPPVEKPDMIGFLRSAAKNGPLWMYVAAFMLCGMGMGVLQVIFTFYDGYLKLGPWYPYLMVVFALTMTGTVPVWTWIAQRIGKHQSYIAAITISSLAMQGYWFIDPNTMPMRTILAISFVVIFCIGASASATVVVSPAILADVADFGRLKTGEQRTGGYYAFYTLTNQIAMAIGAGLAFWLLSAFGYDARAGAVNTGRAAFGMMFTVALMPAVLKIAGAAIMLRFPLNKRRHAVVQRRLAQRDARAALAARG